MPRQKEKNLKKPILFLVCFIVALLACFYFYTKHSTDTMNRNVKGFAKEYVGKKVQLENSAGKEVQGIIRDAFIFEKKKYALVGTIESAERVSLFGLEEEENNEFHLRSIDDAEFKAVEKYYHQMKK